MESGIKDDGLPVVRVGVPLARLEALERRIAEVNERAVRMGAPGLRLVRIGEIPVEVVRVRKVFDGRSGKWVGSLDRISVPGMNVSVVGDAPRIPGWIPIGHVNIKKAYVRAGTGEVRGMPVSVLADRSAEEVRDLLVRRLDAKGRIPCDHCRTTRNRKEALLFAREDDPDAVAVVGSECAADFSGHEPSAIVRGYLGLLHARNELNPTTLTRLFAVLEEYDWKSYELAMASRRVPFATFLALAFDVARKDGFVATGDGPTTAVAAATAAAAGAMPSEEGSRVADRVLRWIPTMGFRRDDLWKARRFGSTIGLDDIGIGASCLLEWCRHEAYPLRGSFLGSIGERIDVTLSVASFRTTVRTFADANDRDRESLIGIWRVITTDGRRGVWRTASEATLPADFECRATVASREIAPDGSAVTGLARLSRIRPIIDARPDPGAQDPEPSPRPR